MLLTVPLLQLFFFLTCKLKTPVSVLNWKTFHVLIYSEPTLCNLEKGRSMFVHVNFAFLLQVAPLLCTLYCVDMQDLAFYPINKKSMRSCLNMPWKDQQKHIRVLFWSCSLRSTRSVVRFYWFLFCWEHVWQLVTVYSLLQYQVGLYFGILYVRWSLIPTILKSTQWGIGCEDRIRILAIFDVLRKL